MLIPFFELLKTHFITSSFNSLTIRITLFKMENFTHIQTKFLKKYYFSIPFTKIYLCQHSNIKSYSKKSVFYGRISQFI